MISKRFKNKKINNNNLVDEIKKSLNDINNNNFKAYYKKSLIDEIIKLK